MLVNAFTSPYPIYEDIDWTISTDPRGAYAPSKPGNARTPGASNSSRRGGLSASSHYDSTSRAYTMPDTEGYYVDEEEIDLASEDYSMQEKFIVASPEGSPINQPPKSNRLSLPQQTANAWFNEESGPSVSLPVPSPGASLSKDNNDNDSLPIPNTDASLSKDNIASDSLSAPINAPAVSSSTDLQHTTTNIHTSTSTFNNNTPSNIASSASHAMLGDEDNSKKRILLPTGGSGDNITSGQNSHKKQKLNPGDLQLKKTSSPELGSDQPSPNPPKKTKPRKAAPKVNDLADEGDKKPRRGSTGMMPGRRGAMLPRRGGRRGGGHRGDRDRRMREASSLSYSYRADEDDEDIEGYSDGYSQDRFHDLLVYGPEEYHDRGREYEPHPYGGPYKNIYSSLQPYYRYNPSFIENADYYEGPDGYYPRHHMAPGSRQLAPLNPNAAPFGPNYRPDPDATASRMSSSHRLCQHPSIPRPSSTQQQPLSLAGFGAGFGTGSSHPMATSNTAHCQLDIPAPTSRPASAHSNTPAAAESVNPTEGDGSHPRQGKIYLAGGIETMVETCPCCRRGF